MDYVKALKQLASENVISPEWSCGDTYESVNCTPTQSEQVLQDAYNRWVSANGYIAERKAAYPQITDQLDMLYHDQINGTTVWKDTITAIKAQYPKPE